MLQAHLDQVKAATGFSDKVELLDNDNDTEVSCCCLRRAQHILSESFIHTERARYMLSESSSSSRMLSKCSARAQPCAAC